MDLSTDFAAFQRAVTDALIVSTRTAGQIASEDLSFHRSSSSAFSSALDAQNVRLLQLTNRLLKAAASNSTSDVIAPQLEDADSVEDNWRGVIDVVDDLLEKADRSLDEFTGIIKRHSPRRDLGEGAQHEKHTSAAGKPNRYLAKIMKKPQEEFEHRVDNFEAGPWKPLLNGKPHAKVPLDTFPESEEAGYNHPYAAEIADYRYPDETYKVASPIAFTPPQDSEAVFVDTEEAVAEMLDELKKADVIAVDLEHHDMHSYIGLVSLMQISTRHKDWIVDTLKPWRENLQVLNEVFADPKILKVFHGSTMDMIWLQRDLGLYVVGLFDTYHAACALNFPKKSLKYLLERFAQFDAQKMYQMSDWRIRPLPAELLDYARSDTHYLLNVFDQIRNLLVEASADDNNLIDYVLEQSKKEALQRYERPVYDRESGLGPVGWYGPLARRSVKFTNEQFAVYKALHEWRDNVARRADEGPGAVMSINSLFNVANMMPSTIPALFTAANPVSKAVRDAQNDLLDLIAKAKDDSKNQPSFWQAMTDIDALVVPTRKHRKPWEKEKPDRNAVQPVEVSDPTEAETTLALPAEESKLWGSTVSANDLRKKDWRSLVLEEALSRILPVPNAAQLITESFKAASTVEPQPLTTPSQPTPTSVTTPTPTTSSPQIFTIKDLKRAERSSKQLLTEQERAARKEAKRAAKAAKKSANNEQDITTMTSTPTNSDGPNQTMKPFDYANAPSVLHAKQDPDLNTTPGTKRKKPSSSSSTNAIFDPYKKATDTKKGAKRLRGETAGKSHTFRS